MRSFGKFNLSKNKEKATGLIIMNHAEKYLVQKN